MDKSILIAGGIGGMTIPALRAGMKLTQQLQTSIEITPAYMVGALLLAGLGAATAWFLKESDRRKAFIIGLSLPATISSLSSQGIGKTEPTAVLRAITAPLAMLVSTAHAAEPVFTGPGPASSPTPAQSFAAGRQFRVVGATGGGVTVKFVDKDGNELDEYVPVGTKTRNLPDAAMIAVIASPSGSRQKITLGDQAGTVTVATVALEKEHKLGFWQALGAPSSIKETLKTTTQVRAVREPGKTLWIKRDDETPMQTMSVSGQMGAAKAYIFARKEINAPYSDGMLLPGDKFTVIEASDPSGRWMKVKLTELAPTPKPVSNRVP